MCELEFGKLETGCGSDFNLDRASAYLEIGSILKSSLEIGYNTGRMSDKILLFLE
jgi:hypothetical protein